MLNRSEFSEFMKTRGTFFSLLSKDVGDVVLKPCFFSSVNQALHLAAFGQLEELKAILEQAKAQPDKTELKHLLLQTSDTITRAGLQVQNKTLLECALGAGDMELAKMIIPYFDEFTGGHEERLRQSKPYLDCIAAIPTQQPDYDITWLIDEIKKSKHKDILAELATGANYDATYQSDLRKAMNKFRSDLLAPERRIITTVRMHCNYQNLIYANVILDRECESLKTTEGDSYDKLRLVTRQILGFIQLVELPAYERYVFARGQDDKAIAGKPIDRSLYYKIPSELSASFPDYSVASINSHSGLGIDFYVSVNDADRVGIGRTLQESCRAKATTGKKFMLQLQQQPDHPPTNEQQSSCVTF